MSDVCVCVCGGGVLPPIVGGGLDAPGRGSWNEEGRWRETTTARRLRDAVVRRRRLNIQPPLSTFDVVAVAYRARQLYKNISMLFLFPVKDGKLSTGVIAIFNASCYG